MPTEDQFQAVAKMQQYILDHVNEEITMKDLARAAGYSPGHASRIFKELTQSNPFDYIRRVRLSQAALELRDSPRRILDVAFDFVFSSHEGFTRAFTKEFGIAPKSYSGHPVPLRLFLPYKVSHRYLERLKGENQSMKSETKGVFVQVVERPQRKAIILRGIKATHYFEYCEEVGCDVWGILVSIPEALYEPVGMWLPERFRKEGTSTYVQGVEVPMDFDKEVPEGFELIELPPCKMMIFQGEPYNDEMFGDAIEEMWEFMKKYDPKLYGFQWADEDAPRFQMEPQGYRGYIEGRPVREIRP